MRSPRVLAVVVAHASGSWLPHVIESLDAQTYPELEAVVVRLGEVEVPAGRRVKAVLDRLPDIGFARAVNTVAAETKADADYVLLLHDDVSLAPDAVERMVEASQVEPRPAAVGAKLVDWDAPEVLQEVGSSIDRFAARSTGLEAHEVDHAQHDASTEVLFCSDACLLVRREALDKMDGLDPGSFPLFEDVDLCWRLRRDGELVVVAPTARVRHVAALSRGLRDKRPDPAGLRAREERGRLRFMLTNYSPLTLAVILPQYAVMGLAAVATGLVRRQFWTFRPYVSAWFAAVRDLGSVIERRRLSGPRRVSDQDLLRLASRRAAVTRRYGRVDLASRIGEGMTALEKRLSSAARDPAVWAGVAAVAVLLLTLRSVLGAGEFTLGEVRPFEPFARAVRHYFAAEQPGSLDAYGRPSAGILLLGLLRSVARSGPAAEKLLLVLPILLAGAGASRLGRVLGLSRARRLLVVLAMINPFTLVLLREGLAGPLILWAATPWVAAVLLLPPPDERSSVLDLVRRNAGWALLWAAVAAMHPPSVLWFLGFGAAALGARAGDGQGPLRVRLLAVGAASAFLLNLPFSLDWFTSRSPLIGAAPGFLASAAHGLQQATFGAGWPVLAWVAVALIVTYVVGPTRATLSASLLLGAAWVAGVTQSVPRGTALAAIGWCSLLLLALVTRRVADELPRFELGWRHALIIGSSATVALTWLAASAIAVTSGTRAQVVPIVPTSEQSAGRVLWMERAGEGTLTWTTNGFDTTMHRYPPAKGPEERLLTRTLEASRQRRTHRAGAVLSLAGVSHIVVLGPEQGFQFGEQADLSPTDRQEGGRVYRNASWRGQAMLLPAPPSAALSARGVADVVRDARRVTLRQRGGTTTLRAGDDKGVVYLASGARSGWRIGGRRATPGAAGVWVKASGLPAPAEAVPGGRAARALMPLQVVAVLALVGAWAAGTYLSGPQAAESARVLPLRPLPVHRLLPLVPVLLVAFAAWWSWTGRSAAAETSYLSSAWYCPAAGRAYSQQIGIVNPSGKPARFLVRPRFGEPATSGNLGAYGRRTIDVDARQGAVVETFGQQLVVGVSVSAARGGGATGSAASLCAPSLPDDSVFSEGGRNALRAPDPLKDEYLITNPFTEPARAAVRFIAPEESVAPPEFQDLLIEPGQTVTVDHESKLEPQPALSTHVSVWQGKAVVARRLSTRRDLAWSIGLRPQRSGTVPRAITRGAGTSLVAANVADDDAGMSVSIIGAEGSLPDTGLDVEANRRAVLDLADTAADEENLLVSYTSPVPVAVESVVVPQNRERVSVLPALVPARRWAIPLAEGRTLLLSNSGTDPARVTMRGLGPGPPIDRITVQPGRMEVVELPEAQEGFGVLLEASSPVAVAAVGGSGSLAGHPLG
ncbi:MAG TPA: glycosyltransferase [Actinomycetota bacterium]|nr:glycosyltransferase [Actinomycetota bacterium]